MHQQIHSHRKLTAPNVIFGSQLNFGPIANATIGQWNSNPQIILSEVYGHYRQSKRNHRSIREIERIFERYILPVLGDSRIAAIDRGDVTLLLDHVATSGSRPAPAMARAVAAQLSALFSWALARLPFLADNPCRLAARPPKPRPRSRILSDRELGSLWSALDQEAMPWNNAIRLLLLTDSGAARCLTPNGRI